MVMNNIHGWSGTLQSWDFGVNGSVFAGHCRMLRRDTNELVCLDVKITNDTDAVHLGKSLVGNTRLEKLSMWIRGRLSLTGACQITNGLKQCKLIELRTDQEGVTEAANEIICALQKMNTIRKLEWNAIIEDDILPSLKSDLFGRILNLESLTLSGMKLTKDVMNDMCLSGLGENISIKNLKLANCGISNASAVAFCNNWRVDSTIGVLEWQGNVLRGTAGVTALCRAVPFHASLNCLKLSGNGQIGYTGLEIIGNAMGDIRLKELHLNDCVQKRNQVYGQHPENTSGHYQVMQFRNSQEAAEWNLEDSRLEKKKRLLRNRAASALIEGSRKNVYLRNIYVRGNDLGEEAEDEIEVCGLCNKYRLAHHHDNSLPAALWQFIFANCQKDRTAKRFIYLLLRENPSLLQIH